MDNGGNARCDEKSPILILCEPSLEQTTIFGFKIINCKGSVGVGICAKNEIVARNFELRDLSNFDLDHGYTNHYIKGCT